MALVTVDGDGGGAVGEGAVAAVLLLDCEGEALPRLLICADAEYIATFIASLVNNLHFYRMQLEARALYTIYLHLACNLHWPHQVHRPYD